MTIAFAEFEITCKQGSKSTRQVHVVDETDRCLGLQVQKCIEGDVYLPIHVPSTALMEEEWGYVDADEARKALIRFWHRLSGRQRYRLSMYGSLRVGIDEVQMYDWFMDEWMDGADIVVCEAGRDE